MQEKKKGQNIKVGQIIKQFSIAVGPIKGQFFSIYVLFFIAQIVNVIVPLYYKQFFDALGKSTSLNLTAPLLVKIITIILLLHIINWLFWRVGMYMYDFMQSKVMSNLRQNAFNYTIKHSHTFFANSFSGGLVQKVGRLSRAFEGLTDTISFNLMPLVITVVGSIWVTYLIAPIISLVMVIWVVITVIFSFLFSTWKLKYDTESSAADSRTTGYLSDSITNNSAVSFFTGHEYESSGFQGVSDDQAKKTLFSWRLGEIVDAVQSLLIMLVEFFIFYYMIRYWSLGLVTIGTFVLAQTYIIGLAQQLWGLNRIVRNFYQHIADSKEMVEIMLTPHEIQDVPDAKKLNVTRGEIVFDDVSFSFGGNSHAIKNLSVNIKAGEKVAVIGPSGAGKTTFVRLIMRMYNVTKGSISIDGQDISKVTQDSLRENISFVPQDPILFHRTLMDNIRYGRRDASDAEVVEAARLAHCAEFIENLPLKYETFVGERGIKLSGGERQRIAIARAILKKALILIFDEATSSLDSYSESLIQDALEKLMKECTTIVIAHRLSTVKKMDRIISMNDGRIVEEGTHDELSNVESGLYKKLWDLQIGGFL
ncbi:MAG TPA: ABC transporter ATP-binding protein [Candidatus Paceibacterota bacterium]